MTGPTSEQPAWASLVHAHERRVSQRMITAWAVLIGIGSLTAIGGLAAAAQHFLAPSQLLTLLLSAGGGAAFLGLIATGVLREGQDLVLAEQLLEHGHYEAAIRRLKKHQEHDQASWLIALAYDRQGATELALESYREYLRRHEDEGVWKVEARVRLRELEARPSAPSEPGVVVQAEPAREPRLAAHCPFCKDALLPDAPSAECAACGTPHHLGCYEEQRGCAVYGCKSHKARARVQEG